MIRKIMPGVLTLISFGALAAWPVSCVAPQGKTFVPYSDGTIYNLVLHDGAVSFWRWTPPLPGTTAPRHRSTRFAGFVFASDAPTYSDSDPTIVAHYLALVVCPLWAVFVVSAAYPGITFLRSNQKQRRAKRGLCVQCGYDLTGNVSGLCPECGSGVSAFG